MGNRLKNMKLNSVDLCKYGANPEANIIIRKNADMKGGTAMWKFLAKILKKNDAGNISDALTEEAVKKAQTDMNPCEIIEIMADTMEDVIEALNSNTELDEASKYKKLIEAVGEFSETLKEAGLGWAVSALEQDVNKDADAEPAEVAVEEQPEETVAEPEEATEEAIEVADDNISEESADEPVEEVATEEEAVVEEPAQEPIAEPEAEPEVEPVEEPVADESVAEEENPDGATPAENKEGDEDKMNIDVTKMAPEEIDALEEQIRKYREAYEPVEKSIEIHPDVQKKLEEFAELKKSMEMKELEDISKKYEICGEKPQELAQKLYNLKKSGGSHYDDYVAVLDKMADAYQKSGLFAEIGKSNTNGGGNDWDKLNGYAMEIQKSMPNLTFAQAIDMAGIQHPELSKNL